MKKLVLLVLLALLAWGCTSWGRSSQPQSDKIQLEFWTMSLSPTFDDYIQGLMKEFEELHPEVELVWLDLPQQAALRKLMASIAAGVAPDLVNLNTEFALVLAQNQALVDMEEAVPEEVQQRYFQGLWEAGRYQDGVYAIPWYVTTRVIMFNRQILAEAGIVTEEGPTTWEQLDAMARQVHQNTNHIGYMPAIKITNDWAMWGVEVVDYEKLEATFDSPEGIARLDRYRQLFQEGVIPPETLTESYRGALDRYKAGSLAFLEAGPQFLLKIASDAPRVYQNTSVAALPESPTRMVPAATMNFAVPRSSKHRELAVELGLFLTNPANQLAFDKIVPILPSTRETAEDPYFQEGKGEPLQDEAVRISVAQLERARDFSLGLPKQQELNRILKVKTEAALGGKLTSEEALHQAAEGWNTILAPFR